MIPKRLRSKLSLITGLPTFTGATVLVDGVALLATHPPRSGHKCHILCSSCACKRRLRPTLSRDTIAWLEDEVSNKSAAI